MIKIREIIIAVIFLLLGIAITYTYFKIEALKIAKKYQIISVEENQQKLKLKTSYFEDFQGRWGSGLKNGATKWIAGDSQFAQRSMPNAVNHPPELEKVPIRINLIKKDGLKKSNAVDEEIFHQLLQETYINFGELLGNFFINRGEAIDSKVEADVDNDGIKEELIITSYIGGNHPPHKGYVVKDNEIVFSVFLESGYIKPTSNGNGFYVTNLIRDDGSALCCSSGYLLYRFIFDKKAGFTPVWEQEVKYLRFD